MSVDLQCQRLGPEQVPAAANLPIVILHGLFGSGTNWRSVARRLATTRPVWLVDLRNHGSSPHVANMDYPSMADDVERLLVTKEISTCALVGHSMGGKTAMRLALQGSERLRRLIVVDIAPVSRRFEFDSIIDAMRSLPLTGATRRDELDSVLAERLPDEGLRAFVLRSLVRESDGFRWRFNLDAIEHCLPKLLDFPTDGANDRFEGPALFMRGSDSDYVLDSHQARIYELFPNSRLSTVDGAGHWVHTDQPEALVRELESFLTA